MRSFSSNASICSIIHESVDEMIDTLSIINNRPFCFDKMIHESNQVIIVLTIVINLNSSFNKRTIQIHVYLLPLSNVYRQLIVLTHFFLLFSKKFSEMNSFKCSSRELNLITLGSRSFLIASNFNILTVTNYITD